MKKLSVYIAVLVALILFPNFIGAQTLTWDETNADSIEYNNYNAGYPQIAISGDRAVAVWMQNDGSYNRIYSNYSTIDDTGVVALWETTNVDTVSNSAGNARTPQIAISGDNVVAVWSQSGLPSSIYSNYAQVVADSSTGDSGSLPFGPLAAGISALLVWWKRRKQKQG